MVPLMLAWWACSAAPVPEELRDLGSAVRAWEAGEAALAAGDAQGALAHFQQARVARPQDALLAVWVAEAARAAGQGAVAEGALDEALALAPSLAVARTARARQRAAQGDAEGAAEDVRVALRLGAWTPRGAARETSIAPLLTHPAFDFLPDAPLSARWEVPEGLAFLGSEVPLTLQVDGVLPGPVMVRAPELSLPLALVRMVEDEETTQEGDRRRVLTWTWRVLGAAEATVPPVTVEQAGVQARTEAFSWTLAAPEGAAPGAAAPLIWPTVEGVRAGVTPPAVHRSGDRWWVVLPPGGVAETTPPGAGSVPWHLRRDGDPVADLVGLSDGVERVVVRVAGQVVLAWSPPP